MGNVGAAALLDVPASISTAYTSQKGNQAHACTGKQPSRAQHGAPCDHSAHSSAPAWYSSLRMGLNTTPTTGRLPMVRPMDTHEKGKRCTKLVVPAAGVGEQGGIEHDGDAATAAA